MYIGISILIGKAVSKSFSRVLFNIQSGEKVVERLSIRHVVFQHRVYFSMKGLMKVSTETIMEISYSNSNLKIYIILILHERYIEL